MTIHIPQNARYPCNQQDNRENGIHKFSEGFSLVSCGAASQGERKKAPRSSEVQVRVAALAQTRYALSDRTNATRSRVDAASANPIGSGRRTPRQSACSCTAALTASVATAASRTALLDWPKSRRFVSRWEAERPVAMGQQDAVRVVSILARLRLCSPPSYTPQPGPDLLDHGDVAAEIKALLRASVPKSLSRRRWIRSHSPVPLGPQT